MSLPKNILDIIISNKTSLGDNPALPPELDEKFLVFLMKDYYDFLENSFNTNDINALSDYLTESITECKRIESPNKDALEKICTEIVNDLFNIPNDTIILDAKLVNKVDAQQERMIPENSIEYSFDSIDDINNLTSEIYKRRLLIALTVGASMYYSANINDYADKLYKLDTLLPHLYHEIMMINNFLLFHTKQSMSYKNTDGGKVDVYLSNPETPVHINSQGVIFPVLLEETIKGVLELAIAHGLPSQHEKAEYIISKTDFKLAEIWDQRLGIPLWKRIIKVFENIGENPIEVGLNFIFMELSQLKPKDFNCVMQELFANTKAGHQIMKQIVNKINYQKEQDEFDDYMINQNKQGQYLITDEDFTSQELINDDLCAKNILDEEY